MSYTGENQNFELRQGAFTNHQDIVFANRKDMGGSVAVSIIAVQPINPSMRNFLSSRGNRHVSEGKSYQLALGLKRKVARFSDQGML